MTDFNKIMYGIAFGSLLSIIVIMILTYNVNEEMYDLARKIMLGNLGIVLISTLLTRYKSTD